VKAVVFAYHNMGLTGLEALKRHGFDILAIFSHQDDPSENCWFGSVSAWSKTQGIRFFTPEDVNTETWIDMLSAMNPDVIFSFYYRHLIGQRILDIPVAGAINLHGSLLPAYRGRVPVNWALINGEKKTGVTLHYMVRKADAGDIIGQRAVDIDFQDTAVMLYGKLCNSASLLLDEVLPLIKSGHPPRKPQDEQRATTFKGRRREDGMIDWQWPALKIYNLIRAVTDPYPGAFTHLPDGKELVLWWGVPEETGRFHGQPGTVSIEGRHVRIGTGDGAIKLLDIGISGMRYRHDEIYSYFKSREGIRLI
jgi:methionyl-tRNA formyltransferase